jgi:hypothetical protein
LPFIANHKLIVARLADGLKVSQDVIRQRPLPNIEFAPVPEIDAPRMVDRAGVGVLREVIHDGLLLGGRKRVHPIVEIQRAWRPVQ